MGWGTSTTMCQLERVCTASQAEGSVSRGRAFGDFRKLIMSCLKGTMGMCKIYCGLIREKPKDREMEGSNRLGRNRCGKI